MYRALARARLRRLRDDAARRAARGRPAAVLRISRCSPPRRRVATTSTPSSPRRATRRSAVAREARTAVEVFPPVPAALARRAGLERGQVLVQSAERGALQRFLPHGARRSTPLPGRRVRWALDVDPAGLRIARAPANVAARARSQRCTRAAIIRSAVIRPARAQTLRITGAACAARSRVTDVEADTRSLPIADRIVAAEPAPSSTPVGCRSSLERPKQAQHGDYASNVALQLAQGAEAQSARARAGARRGAAAVAAGSRRPKSPAPDSSTSSWRPRRGRRSSRASSPKRDRLRPQRRAGGRARDGRVRFRQSDRAAARRPWPAGGAGRRDRQPARNGRARR